MTEQPPGSYPPPPGGGYPPPPPPQGGGFEGAGYPGSSTTSGTNGLAIASLVCSVLGLVCGIGSIVGIVLGVIALNQIKKTGQQGKGLATAGVVVGAVFLVLGIIGGVVILSGM